MGIRPNAAKAAALAVSIAFQAALLAVMLHDAGFPPARGADDPATRVVFIHSAPSAAPVITPAHPRTKPAQHARRNTARVPAYAASNETQPPAVTAKASHPGGLDLSLAPLSLEFHGNSIASRPPALESVTYHLQVTMIDSSLGGRLRAMTKQRICGELRAALTNHAESHASIRASLREYGCLN